MYIRVHVQLYMYDVADTRCDEVSGEAYLDVFFPDAVDNMTLNNVVLAANIVCFWLIDIIAFSVRGVRNMH